MKTKILFLLSVLLTLIGCQDRITENTYDPVVASGQATGFALSIIDEKGNDLLMDKNFVGKLSATGHLSKKTYTFSSVRWEKEGGLNFIDVYTDLPDSKTMQPIITPTTKKSYGSSGLTLKIDNTTINLNCEYEYSNSATDKPKMFGGTGIYLIKIKLNNGEEVAFEDINNKKLTLVYSNGTLSIKK